MIILVEESSSDEMLTLRALEKASIASEDVVVMRDGAAAWDFLRDAPLLPHLVLLDLNLPKFHGHQVLQQMRSNERTRRLPVVILTSSHEDGDILDGYGFGANNYIVKPVDPVQFAELVRQLGLQRLLR